MVKTSEHVFIAGRTGSGKTYLAKNYLARYPIVFVLDVKGTFRWTEAGDEVEYCFTFSELVRVAGAKDFPGKMVYQPVFEELNEDAFNNFFQFCYLRGNCIAYVDEVMSVTPSPLKIPEYMRAILTRGRELGVGLWALTQRPTSIPLITMSEASHFFVFALNLEKDRQRLVEITACKELEEKPGRFEFWYYNIYQEKPVLAKIVTS